LSVSTTTRCARRQATPSRRRETAPPDGQSRYYRRTVTLSGESRCFGAVLLESGYECRHVGEYGFGAGSRFLINKKWKKKISVDLIWIHIHVNQMYPSFQKISKYSPKYWKTV
jgi:hypothetical protein